MSKVYPERRITYVSEQGREFSEGLVTCTSLRKLREYLEYWWPLAQDAYEAAWQMDAKAWKEFKAGRALEASGTYAGDAWAARYGPILMPGVIFRVSYVAAQFQVPWGTAFIRLKEAGLIQKVEGVFVCKG